MLGYGSFYNHSSDPSAEYIEEVEDTLTFKALREIPAGEEITIDYGSQWWEDRELEPE
jgi:SET domain-containing protein